MKPLHRRKFTATVLASLLAIMNTSLSWAQPTASNPLPLSVQCIGDVPPPDVLVVTDEADVLAVPVVTWEADLSDGNSCPETITRTYKVTGDNGIYIFVYQTITIQDTTYPTGTTPSTIYLPTGSMAPAPDVLVVTDEADNCSANPTVVWVSDVSDGLDPETITRTYCIYDDCALMFCVEQLIIIGIAEIESAVLNDKLKIFPNPSEGIISISFGKVVENIDLSIRDLNGKVLYSNSYEATMELGLNLPQTAGVYMLTLQVNNSEVRTFRILRR